MMPGMSALLQGLYPQFNVAQCLKCCFRQNISVLQAVSRINCKKKKKLGVQHINKLTDNCCCLLAIPWLQLAILASQLRAQLTVEPVLLQFTWTSLPHTSRTEVVYKTSDQAYDFGDEKTQREASREAAGKNGVRNLNIFTSYLGHQELITTKPELIVESQ